MRFFFINALLLLATTSTLAVPVPVALVVGEEKGSISLHKQRVSSRAGDKHAILNVSSIPNTATHPHINPANDDKDAGPSDHAHASLVRRM
jgi:hypothetical protein